MKNIKYFILMLAIAGSFSSCIVRGHRGDHGPDMHHDDHHDDHH